MGRSPSPGYGAGTVGPRAGRKSRMISKTVDSVMDQFLHTDEYCSVRQCGSPEHGSRRAAGEGAEDVVGRQAGAAR